MTTRYIPALATNNLCYDATTLIFDKEFHYCIEIRRLKFLKNSKFPDIVYVTNQCTHFSKYQREPRGAAIESYVRYMALTKSRGIVLDANKKYIFEVLQMPISVDTGTSQHSLKISVTQSHIPDKKYCMSAT